MLPLYVLTILTGIGLFGILGMTVLFPALARFLQILGAYKAATRMERASPFKHLAILIPAHNEERAIGATIRSIQLAVENARKRFPDLKVTLQVAADGCRDETAAIARALGANVIEFNPNVGKWSLLNRLARANAEAEWIAYADSGVLWNEDLVVRCIQESLDPAVIAVAPTYQNPSAGGMEKALWILERVLKRWEDGVGGPMSVHGATVFYRTPELLEVLSSLESKHWLNDDVAIPLSLRIRNPEKRIRYLTDIGVHDSPESQLSDSNEPIREFGRRKRMVMGNLQWVLGILPGAFLRNPMVALLSLRRVFRIFWAYWGLISAGCMAYVVARSLGSTVLTILPAFSVFIILFVLKFRKPVLRLADSAAASLFAPASAVLQGLGLTQLRWK